MHRRWLDDWESLFFWRHYHGWISLLDWFTLVGYDPETYHDRDGGR